MEIIVDKEEFSKELKYFQGIFEKKSLIDILQNIKFTAFENNLIELVATDLEIGLVSNFKSEVVTPGSFTLNGVDIYNIISRMPEGNIRISDNNDLQVFITDKNNRCRFKLSGMESSDYPQLPISDFSNHIDIDSDQFKDMIDKCYYVLAPELKYNVGGAMLQFLQDKIELISTDSHRLSYTASANTHQNESFNEKVFILSRKTLVEILKIAESDMIRFTFDKNNLYFKVGNRILSSRMIDQKYPDYKNVIPRDIKHSAVIDREDLLESLRRILIFKIRNDAVYFKFSKNKLVLERTSQEKGEAHDELDIKYDGKDFKCVFPGGFIIDFLTHIEDDAIIDISDESDAYIFRSKPSRISEFLYVVMSFNI